MRVHVPGHKVGEGEVEKGGPAGVDDVDEHEDLAVGHVDEDVAWLVVRAVVGKFNGLIAEGDGEGGGEGCVWQRAVVRGERGDGAEEDVCFGVGDVLHSVVAGTVCRGRLVCWRVRSAGSKDASSSDMVVVRVAVDEFLHRLVCNVGDCILQIYAERGRVVDGDDSVTGNEKEGLVSAAIDNCRLVLAYVVHQG